MAFFEIKKGSSYDLPPGPLRKGSLVVGKINGERTVVTVLDDDRIKVGEEILERRGLVFDSEGGRLFENKRGLVWLDRDGVIRLRLLHSIFVESGVSSPGAFRDSLGSLWRQAEIQAGLRDRNKWTPLRFLLAVLSAGRTEDFQDDG
jgi:hypothetical protein